MWTTMWTNMSMTIGRPGANVLGNRVLEYIFEVLVLVEIMDHVLVRTHGPLTHILRVLYEYVRVFVEFLAYIGPDIKRM